MTYRTKPGFYIDAQNERHADLAEMAVAQRRTRRRSDAAGVFTDVADTLAHLIHFCRRAGIDWDAAVEKAAEYATGDLTDGPPVKRDTDRFPIAPAIPVLRRAKS
jgi:hypothetical protein